MRNSSLFLYNASYLRLKNVEIGYTFTQKCYSLLPDCRMFVFMYKA